MKKSNLIAALVAICVMLSFGCKNKVFHFYSKDKKQCISIINERDVRYIADGYQTEPKGNYVKIDLKGIDRHVGDEMVGCWNKNGLGWELMMDGVTILENRLDSSKYVFRSKFPINDRGIPSLENFNRTMPRCFGISFEYQDLLNLEGDALQ